MIKHFIHYQSTDVECVSTLCPGDQLPPPCEARLSSLAGGVVLCRHYPLIVVEHVDTVILSG